ncbi:MAG: cbb3-type cytochrome oxidase assembly protein CcoS [Acidobacteria bacterium]|nr:cbb3-type cytochrome oxidase assembly protein CcoS [Acidobacteriota bacterium]MCG3193168.1 hypothetical protein [Thermoanaerobaculia bacterium]MCK6683418.1 cbb3-type cytochrome oxidase assembly protein CcoS [Thermoanaerobaculia bacterium]
METVFVLLPLALLIAGIALALFIWAVRSGQFDDLETPAVRILFDDEAPPRRNGSAPSVPPLSPGAKDNGENSKTDRQTTEAASTRRDPE